MKRLRAQFILIQAIRDFFKEEGLLDVLTPPMVENPGMETHIHPFAVHSTYRKEATGCYLHTSPEFHMKELISQGLTDIFTISYCFRDEPKSPIHRAQFLMLEWYRGKAHYTQIMDDCEKLFNYCLHQMQQQGFQSQFKNGAPKMERATVDELFQKHLGFSILDYLDIMKLREKIRIDFPDITLPQHSPQMLWDDYFFLLFLNKIEPLIAQKDFLLLYEYPAPLAALSTLKKEDPRVCERFEIYVKGVELANCFNELLDIEEQKERFQIQKEEKKLLYGYELPEPQVLYQALERGLPTCAGIALGVERLLYSVIDIENPFYN